METDKEYTEYCNKSKPKQLHKNVADRSNPYPIK